MKNAGICLAEHQRARVSTQTLPRPLYAPLRAQVSAEHKRTQTQAHRLHERFGLGKIVWAEINSE